MSHSEAMGGVFNESRVGLPTVVLSSAKLLFPSVFTPESKPFLELFSCGATQPLMVPD